MFSKNIFKDIERLIFNTNNDHLSIRGEHRDLIISFLQNPDFDTTLALYNFVSRIHKKEYVFNLMDSLRLYESGFAEILPEHREHYMHSASVYVLGLAIYNGCSDIQKACNTERHDVYDVSSQKASFLFRWSLTACLHDLAYPLELSLKSFNSYSSYLHGIEKSIKYSFITVDPDIYERFNLLPIIEPDNDANGISRKDTAIGMIADFLTRQRLRNSPITYETLLNVLNSYLRDNLRIGRIDHGVFSALIILKRIHELYIRNNWDIWDYYYEVVDASTAIFLHNSYKYSELKNIFGNGKFLFNYPSALGYLLYLTDSLCEWLRGTKNDYKLYGVHANDNVIVFRVPRKTKIEINSAAKLFDNQIPVIITDRWGFQI